MHKSRDDPMATNLKVLEEKNIPSWIRGTRGDKYTTTRGDGQINRLIIKLTQSSRHTSTRKFSMTYLPTTRIKTVRKVFGFQIFVLEKEGVGQNFFWKFHKREQFFRGNGNEYGKEINLNLKFKIFVEDGNINFKFILSILFKKILSFQNYVK